MHHLKLDKQFNIQEISDGIKQNFSTYCCKAEGNFLFQFIQPQIPVLDIMENLIARSFASYNCVFINEQQMENMKFVCTILPSTVSEEYSWDCWLYEVKANAFEEMYLQEKLEFQHFIYKVSHDIQGPVKSIKGLLSLLETENNSQPVQDIHSKIFSLTDRLDDLIYKLLDIVNIKSKSRVEARAIDFEEIIYKTLDKINKEKDISNLFFKVDKKAETEFISQYYYIEVIFQHLIANAIEAFEDKKGGELKITIDKNLNNELVLEFRNNGPTIPDDFCQKMFNMFNRGKKIGNHPGLGLYLVKKTVEILGGNIICFNDSDEVCFRLTLPNMVYLREIA
ncbi:sensor histidine kinase [Chondrinema litorale]|uniref:sensor histidine kinase n=1 Tax=Chondrinema litorale TaxID=2994555 RepID=UPI0025435A11|nr:HAMP domain-containing sensor histidine kinase [Chondrinema litorale]UZR99905.1 HAMP domain-containing sensor histidine kinase [Chondrinema litorale]